MDGRLLLVLVSCWGSDFDWSDGSASLSIFPVSSFPPLDLNSLEDEPRNRTLVLCSSFDDESAGIVGG